ncbi:MAG TPA: thioredoxin [Candidatus Aminicenantes bacterium]|nr:thioredoxin [Candidatus Aminicenantes bacterium]
MTMEKLDKKAFTEKIFDFEKEKEWKYLGARPAIIDFYADWCGPCKMVAPILEKIAAEYGGKLDVYKVDTDKEQELAGAFGIQSIPSLLFIPASGQPQMARGALDRAGFDKVIADVLQVKKDEPKQS